MEAATWGDVDKALSGVKAVQWLARLNPAHPHKHDCFVLDFQNNSATITVAFHRSLPRRAALLASQRYKQFVENEAFRRTVRARVSQLANQGPSSPPGAAQVA